MISKQRIPITITAPLLLSACHKKAVRKAFDAVGIGMCAWAYTNTFPLYNSNTKEWLPGMLDAMGLKDN